MKAYSEGHPSINCLYEFIVVLLYLRVCILGCDPCRAKKYYFRIEGRKVIVAI
jgi:hypothetical protein